MLAHLHNKIQNEQIWTTVYWEDIDSTSIWDFNVIHGYINKIDFNDWSHLQTVFSSVDIDIIKKPCLLTNHCIVENHVSWDS